MDRNKIDKEVKKHMEREFRQYYINKKQIEKMELEIISNSIENIKNTSTRTILYLKQRILYIENVINQLKPFEREVFDLIFKDNRDWIYCETIKNIHKNTYYNLYNKCIILLAEEWGYI